MKEVLKSLLLVADSLFQTMNQLTLSDVLPKGDCAQPRCVRFGTG